MHGDSHKESIEGGVSSGEEGVSIRREKDERRSLENLNDRPTRFASL